MKERVLLHCQVTLGKKIPGIQVGWKALNMDTTHSQVVSALIYDVLNIISQAVFKIDLLIVICHLVCYNCL